MREVNLKKQKTERNKLELYFEWFFSELKDHGYIKDFYREPTTIYYREPEKIKRLKVFKSKAPRIEEVTLFPKLSYTADYKVVWEEKARYYFFEDAVQVELGMPFAYGVPVFLSNTELINNKEEYISYFDVKPTSAVSRKGRVSTSSTFYLKQRMIFETSGRYINKFIPIPMAGAGKRSAIFPNVFTPQRYLFTDGGKQIRKIKFPITDLNGYIHKKKQEMEIIDKYNQLFNK